MVGPGSVSGWATKILQDVWHRQREVFLSSVDWVLSTQKQRSVYPPLTCSTIAWSGARDREVPNSMEKRCHQVILNVVSSPRQDAARPHLGGLNRSSEGTSLRTADLSESGEKGRLTLLISATSL